MRLIDANAEKIIAVYGGMMENKEDIKRVEVDLPSIIKNIDTQSMYGSLIDYLFELIYSLYKGYTFNMDDQHNVELVEALKERYGHLPVENGEDT